MPEVGVICAHASSPRKLEKKLARLLARHAADDVLEVSHWTETVSSKQSGGIWSGARQVHKLEYSAIVLFRLTEASRGCGGGSDVLEVPTSAAPSALSIAWVV